MTPPDEARGQYHSYLVRLWQDEAKSERVAAQRWQGEVLHIQSGQTWHFRDYEALLRLLNDHTHWDAEQNKTNPIEEGS